MQIKSLRIKSCRSWAIADTASEAVILGRSPGIQSGGVAAINKVSGYAGLTIYAASPRLDSRLRPAALARMTGRARMTLWGLMTPMAYYQQITLVALRG